jgi:hypothetical protein
LLPSISSDKRSSDELCRIGVQGLNNQTIRNERAIVRGCAQVIDTQFNCPADELADLLARPLVAQVYVFIEEF